MCHKQNRRGGAHFHNLVNENKTILFLLPVQYTYFTQPTDGGNFQPFMHCLTDAIDKIVCFGHKISIKLEFWAAFQSFCN